MNRKKIGVTLLILGSITVFTSEFTFTPEFFQSSEIGKEQLKRRIQTNITVKEVERRESITIIEAEKTELDIVRFKKVPKSIQKGEKLNIIGRVGKYRGSLQIVVDELVVR